MSCDTCTEGTNIFSTYPGQVAVVGDNTLPAVFNNAIAVDGDILPFEPLRAIITSIGVQGQGGFQFMHAMREMIFVYIFTERIGEIVINGLAFPYACETDEPTEPDPEETCAIQGDTGLERVLTWYECNRITTRAEPVTITLGTTLSYEAFLIGCKADVANADMGIAQFSFRFNFVPNTVSDDFCFPFEQENCIAAPCQ